MTISIPEILNFKVPNRFIVRYYDGTDHTYEALSTLTSAVRKIKQKTFQFNASGSCVLTVSDDVTNFGNKDLIRFSNSLAHKNIEIEVYDYRDSLVETIKLIECSITKIKHGSYCEDPNGQLYVEHKVKVAFENLERVFIESEMK